MQVRFLLGPAGSGKTFRCLAEVRAELRANPEGRPLLFLAPKQATFQLERRLLEEDSLPGYTRLQILSFERLAELILAEFGVVAPEILDEEGRLMVLRALLRKHQPELAIFRSTARLPGFAQQLSSVLRDLQQSKVRPSDLAAAAERPDLAAELKAKLQDLALIQFRYQQWLQENELRDSHTLLDLAADALQRFTVAPADRGRWSMAGLWLDGFAEITPQEMALLAAVLPLCDRATLAFCLDRIPEADLPWLSLWCSVAQTFRKTHAAVSAIRGATVSIEVLSRRRDQSRFISPQLAHLELCWGAIERPREGRGGRAGTAVRIVRCPDPHSEATAAAREIRAWVSAGGRFRDISVMVRDLTRYSSVVRRVFSQYEIPFFLDQRESIAHHPLAELTRSVLRTVAYCWRLDDWFAALKSNLLPATEPEIDWLENQAFAQRWVGDTWLEPFPSDIPDRETAERIRQQVVSPVLELGARLGGAPPFCVTGFELAQALQRFWSALKIEEKLDSWSESPSETGAKESDCRAIHATVWEQMQRWLENLARGFADERLPLREWLPILEAGLAHLTVGIIPPALDQVLIGAIDRTRNPEIRETIVLGLNSSVFPAVPPPPPVLTERDREQLAVCQIAFGMDLRQKLATERYLGYIALTRARERVMITHAASDGAGRALHPSPFLDALRDLFPDLAVEEFQPVSDWDGCAHPSELTALLFSKVPAGSGRLLPQLEQQWGAGLAADLQRWCPHLQRFPAYSAMENLAPEIASELYGARLRLSVTRLENFGACPFKFFVRSGLGAEERQRLEFDATWLGSFQHEILRQFHETTRSENRHWRDLTPQEGVERIRQLVDEHWAQWQPTRPTQRDAWAVRQLSAMLQRFVRMALLWMPQYQFNPLAVELRFGEGAPLPAFELELSNHRKLVFSGGIDRVDLAMISGEQAAYCVVIDYKSRSKKVDDLLLAHGVQLQLPTYLAVLRSSAAALELFGVRQLIPAGVFYVNLRGQFPPGAHRNEVIHERDESWKMAYRHFGRFNAEVLRRLDSRTECVRGDQFNYTIKKSGELSRQSRDALDPAEFERMLREAELQLKTMGEAILAGEASVSPYRRGAETPCDFCEYHSICRIDPWTHSYRTLAPKADWEAPCR